MANLYLVRDGAANDFYVVADDDISAKVAYQDWVQDPDNGMDHENRLPVQHVEQLASQDLDPVLNRVTFIIGPTS